MNVPTIQTERLRLELLNRRHSEGMFQMWSEPEVCRYSGPACDVSGDPITLPAVSPDDSDKIIDFFQFRSEEGTGFRWAVISRDTGAFLGAIGFNSLGDSCELAYHLDPRYWGKGFMSEAAEAAVDWALRDFGAEEIEAFIEPDNVPSIHLIERLGLAPTEEIDGEARKYSIRASDKARKAGVRLHSEEDALALIGSGLRGCVLTPDDLHPDFFDLRNGIAGAIFQKLINYSFRIAIVIRKDHTYGERVLELMRDHASHPHIRFFTTIDEARGWIDADT